MSLVPGDREDTRVRSGRRPVGANVARVGLVLAIAFGALAGGAGYWQVVRSAPLSSAPDNPRSRSIPQRDTGESRPRRGVARPERRRDAKASRIASTERPL